MVGTLAASASLSCSSAVAAFATWSGSTPTSPMPHLLARVTCSESHAEWRKRSGSTGSGLARVLVGFLLHAGADLRYDLRLGGRQAAQAALHALVEALPVADPADGLGTIPGAGRQQGRDVADGLLDRVRRGLHAGHVVLGVRHGLSDEISPTHDMAPLRPKGLARRPGCGSGPHPSSRGPATAVGPSLLVIRYAAMLAMLVH